MKAFRLFFGMLRSMNFDSAFGANPSPIRCRLVSHDYVTVRPDYYTGMRSYGRDWQNMQPGALFSHLGENLSVSPCPPGIA